MPFRKRKHKKFFLSLEYHIVVHHHPHALFQNREELTNCSVVSFDLSLRLFSQQLCANTANKEISIKITAAKTYLLQHLVTTYIFLLSSYLLSMKPPSFCRMTVCNSSWVYCKPNSICELLRSESQFASLSASS